MKPTFKILLPEPCVEPWEEMTPENRGRHCKACAKTVIDFTRMTNAQILEVLRTKPNACGRFWPHQLNRTLLVPPAQKRFSFAAIYKLVAGLLLMSAAGKVTATEKPYYTQEMAPHANQWNSSIEGVVMDDKGEPLTGATVEVEGTTLKAIADADGYFLLKMRDSTETGGKVNLSFSYPGFVTVHVSEVILIADQTVTVNSVLHFYSSADSVNLRQGIEPNTTLRYAKALINLITPTQGVILIAKEIEKMSVREVEAKMDAPQKKWWQFWKRKTKQGK